MSDDDYDELEIKPNNATAYAGLLLSLIVAFAGGIVATLSETAQTLAIGQALLAAGVVGVFVMVGVMAVVSAIYKHL